MEKVLTALWDTKDSHTLDAYRKVGGYEVAKDVIANWDNKKIVDTVKESGLRGRGGAGFPTGLKWSFVPRQSPKPKYLCVNADESEPGTAKDRYVLERTPHLLIEGTLIAARALDSHHAFIYCRGEFYDQLEIMRGAVAEARAA